MRDPSRLLQLLPNIFPSVRHLTISNTSTIDIPLFLSWFTLTPSGIAPHINKKEHTLTTTDSGAGVLCQLHSLRYDWCNVSRVVPSSWSLPSLTQLTLLNLGRSVDLSSLTSVKRLRVTETRDFSGATMKMVWPPNVEVHHYTFFITCMKKLAQQLLCIEDCVSKLFTGS